MTRKILFFFLLSLIIITSAAAATQQSSGTYVSLCGQSNLTLKSNISTADIQFTVNENQQFPRQENSDFPEQVRAGFPLLWTRTSQQQDTWISQSAAVLTMLPAVADAETGAISGRVTNSNCVGLENISVAAYYGYYQYYVTTQTDAQGNYTVTGLPSGEYHVRFWGAHFGYLDKWYNNIRGTRYFNLCNADPVIVNAPAVTTGIDAFLEKGAEISGRVVNLTGQGLENIRIMVFHESSYGSFVSRTDNEGYYTVSGQRTGEFKLYYKEDPPGNPVLVGYAGEWYNNKTDYHTADFISVTAPESRTLADVVMEIEPLGGISGQVTLSETDGIEGIAVVVWDYQHSSMIQQTLTDQDGNYSVDGLPGGEYLIDFADNNSEYARQWYHGHNAFQTSDTVTVVPPAITPNIDAKLQRAGRITGHVPFGVNGLAWSRVMAFNQNGDVLGSASIDENGSYAIEGLPSGQYILQFDLSEAGYEWYQGKDGYATADTVQVNAPDSTTHIDSIRFPIAEKGSLSGKVTDKCTGEGIGDISVGVYSAGWNYFGSTKTDCSGAYIITELPVGEYQIFFRITSEREPYYIGQWYNNAPNHAHGDTVTITADQTTENIDAQMQYGGMITGRLTDADNGSGIKGIYPMVYGINENAGVIAHPLSTTDDHGNYAIYGVPPGDVKVQFMGKWMSRYGNQWYQSQPDHARATPVTVTPFAITSGIDDVFSIPGKPFFSPHIIMLLLGGDGQEICDAIVEDSQAIVSGMVDYYSVPMNTTYPPLVTLTAGTEGSVLIIGDPNSTIEYESVEVALSPHITDVSVGLTPLHYFYITATEGAGKCQFEKRPQKDPPEEGSWFRDNDGVHYTYTLQ